MTLDSPHPPFDASHFSHRAPRYRQAGSGSPSLLGRYRPSVLNALYHACAAVLTWLCLTLSAQSQTPPHEFTDLGSLGLTGLSFTALDWGDFDNDGDLDVAITGAPTSFGAFSGVFRNDGGTFVNIAAPLEGVSLGDIEWGDYDNDGDLDLLLAGRNPSLAYSTKLYRNDGGSFVDVSVPLVGVQYASVAWGDYDNDGDLDILLVGRTSNFNRDTLSKIYRNDNGTFTDVAAVLPELSFSDIQWGDYDGDGDLDILAAGTGIDGARLAQVLRNDGDATFVNISAPLVPVTNGSIDWGDYDNDGDLDILLTGQAGDGQPRSLIYRNDGSSGFTATSFALAAVFESDAAWGDHDNDGDLDILLTGRTGSPVSYITRMYRNDGVAGFTDINTSTIGVDFSDVAWGDFDNDGDLDFLISGRDNSITYITRLVRNDSTVANAPPLAPSGLNAVNTSPTSRTLSWNATTDAQTPSAGLSYNLRVGTTPGGSDVLSPMSLADGRRKVAKRGPVAGTSLVLEDLTPGQTYYWSVQAIDPAFAGSPFAAESSFTLPQIGQSISFTQPASPLPFAANQQITLEATGGASGNPVTFTLDPGSTGSGSIAGAVLTVTAPGTFVINANQAGNATYAAAPQVQRTLVVLQQSLVVTTTTDENNGNSDPAYGTGTSLREAIAYAATLTGPQTITFSDSSANGAVNFHDGATRTITLGGAQIEIASHVTITGPGADRLTISGDNRSRIFNNATASLTVSGLTLEKGNGNNDAAGAIYSNKALKLTDCRLTGNRVSTTRSGCALSQWEGTLELTRCTFSGNGGNAVGGALYATGVNFQITDCVFSDNTTTNGGGAIVFTGGSSGTIRGTAFSNNMSHFSGGALLLQDPFVRLENCTFSGNRATTEGGGAIYAFGFIRASEVSLTNCTIVDNSSVAGGGIYLGNRGKPVVLSLANTILSGNSVGALEQRPNTTLLSQGHNLCSDSGGGLLTHPSDLINTDPLLSPLRDNGGPAPTHALLAGSPAIDAGNSALAVDENNQPLTTDQRGQARTVKGNQASSAATVDIGAYERFAAPTFSNPALSVVNGGSIVDLTAAGASPSGGTFSGTGVTGSTFDPAGLAPGSYTITYTVSDSFGISNQASFTVTVTEAPNLVVTTTSDEVNASDGQTSLREAITYANTLTERADITFNIPGGGTIALAAQNAAGARMLPILTNPNGITIDGANGGQGAIAIDGGSTSDTTGDRVFFIGVSDGEAAATTGFGSLVATTATQWAIRNLTIQNGNARGGNGGSGTVRGGGGAGLGGGVFVNAGALTLDSVDFLSCRAVGGSTGSSPSGFDSGGGGLGGNGGAGGSSGRSGGGGFGIGADGGTNFSAGQPGFYTGAAAGGAGSGGGIGGIHGGGAGSGGNGGGGGVGGGAGTTGAGGAGGFGGGGGGGFFAASTGAGGAGGFGGGGGGSNISGGNGGFGGGGGQGGFSGGFPGNGGFGAGNGTGSAGGGGLGAGGTIFVRQGASVTVMDGGVTAGRVVAGTGANPGQGIGSGIFLAGSATWEVTSGEAVTLDDSLGGGTDAQITGGFTKTGPGLLILNGTHSHTGGTTVNDGTLAVDGTFSASDATTITGNATLGGNGTIVGPVNVTGGGQIYPATGSIGTLRTGPLTFASGTTLRIDVFGATSHDKLESTGAVDLGGATLAMGPGASLPPGSAPVTILEKQSAGPITGTFAGLSEGSIFNAGGSIFRISYIGGDGNDVTLEAVIENLTRAQADATFDLFAATGQAPGSGTFSGPGVSGSNYQPGAAVGVNTITFTPNTGSPVTFTITVTETPNLTVTTTSDTTSNTDGQTTLREAFDHAVTLTGPQTITFSTSTANGAENFHDGTARTIALGTRLNLFQTGRNITIAGPGADRLKISGAGLRNVFAVGGGTELTLSDLTVADGFSIVSEFSTGGAILNSGTLTLLRCVVRDSGAFVGVSGTRGGGLFTSGNTTIIGSTFTGNSVGRPGVSGFARGAAIYATATARVKVINSTISGNTAVVDSGTAEGAGIYAEGSGEVIELINTTVTANTATVTGGAGATGGGVFGDVTAQNTIIAGNTSSGSSPNVAGNVVSGGHNLIYLPGSDTTFSGDTTGNLTDVDPALSPLAANSGSTPTHALLAGSPAIDAGSNALALDASNQTLTTDQRGQARTVKGNQASSAATVDIGAYELFAAPVFSNPALSVVSGGGVADLAAAGASPAGGTFSGTGVTGTTFDPTGLGLGSYTVTYTVSDGSGASNRATFTVTVAETPSLTVTTSSDTSTNTDGLTSLREAFAHAKTLGGAQTVRFNGDPEALPRATGTGIVDFHDGAVHTLEARSTLVINNPILTVIGTSADRLIFRNFGNPGTLLSISNGSTVELSGVTVTGSASSGISSQNSDLTLRGCAVSGNAVDSDNTNGGGIYHFGGNLTLVDSTVSDNAVQGLNRFGGGIYNHRGTVTLRNSTVSGNSLNGIANNYGAGIYNEIDSTLILVNSTVSGNSSNNGTNVGAGIYSVGTLELINCTVTDNSASGGSDIVGGVANLGIGHVRNSIISGNTASAIQDWSGPFATDVNNLIGDQPDLRLAPLGAYGGPTMTHALLPGSSAIDAGDNSLAVDESSAALTNDQRGPGFARIVKGSRGTATATVDIGAFELFATPRFSSDALSLSIAAAPLDLAQATGVSPTGGTFSGPGVSGGFFDPRNQAPGVYTLTYTVTDAFGVSNFADFTVTVGDLPPSLTVTGPQRFKTTSIGSRSRPGRISIRNVGGLPTGTLRVSVSGPGKKDFIVTQPGVRALAAGEATVVEAVFRPRKTGNRRASVTVYSDAPPVSVTVQGRGRAYAALRPPRAVRR